MNNELTDRVEFDLIRYANCWEDADILVQALQIKPGDRVLSIASAGDNSFALLAQNPDLVVAVDVNPVQLYLCELKKAAFTLPNHYAFLEFLGFQNGTNRLNTYRSLRNQLSEDAQKFWNDNTELIENGIISQGKFEKYFRFFRSRLLPLIHTKKERRNYSKQNLRRSRKSFTTKNGIHFAGDYFSKSFSANA